MSGVTGEIAEGVWAAEVVFRAAGADREAAVNGAQSKIGGACYDDCGFGYRLDVDEDAGRDGLREARLKLAFESEGGEEEVRDKVSDLLDGSELFVDGGYEVRIRDAVLGRDVEACA